MKFKNTIKAPECLAVGEKTAQTGGIYRNNGLFHNLLMRRSKKGYQVGVEGNWSVMFKHFSDIPKSEIDLIMERMV
jgi:hypothetical protein